MSHSSARICPRTSPEALDEVGSRRTTASPVERSPTGRAAAAAVGPTPMEPAPSASVAYGFTLAPRASLSRTTVLIEQAALLFDVSSPDTPYEELQRLVVEENVLLKRTHANRRQVFRGLREMYGLRQSIPLYRVLRLLWLEAEPERRLLAMLTCLAREPVLRATAPLVLAKRPGDSVTPAELEREIEQHLPGRYSTEV